MFLDLKTVLFLYVAINAIGIGVVAVIWQQNRKRLAGTEFWLAAVVLQVAGLIPVISQGLVPDFVYYVLSGAFILAGIIMLLIGLERFTGETGTQIHNYILLALFVVVQIYYSFIQPDLSAREINVSVATFIFTFQCFWLMTFRVDRPMRRMTQGVGMVFAGYVLISIIRILAYTVIPLQGNDFFQSGVPDALIISAYILLNAGLIFSLTLMVNGRLLQQINVHLEDKEAATQRLGESEAKYREITENFLTGIYIGQAGHYVYVNKRFAEMHGYEPDELLGMEYTILIDPESLQEIRSIRSGLQKGESTINPPIYRRFKKNGDIFWAEQTITNIEYQGKPAVMGNIIDITERRQAEDALRDSEERYRTLVESSPDLIAIVQDGYIKYMNQAACDKAGWPLEEMTSPSFDFIAEMIPQERAELDREHMQKRLAGGEIAPYETILKTRAGITFPVLLNARIIQYQGKPAILYIMVDLSELKQAQDRWQFALEGASDGLWDLNVQTTEVYFSRQWKAVLGYEENEIGNTVDDWFTRLHPDDRDRVLIEIGKHFEGTVPVYSSEHRMRCNDGSYKWVMARGKLISWTEDGKPLRFIGIHTDITEHKRLEEERQNIAKLESVGTLAGGIAHDFNNILQGILGNIALARMEIKESDPIDELLREAEVASLRAKNLTYQLLTFSRGGTPIKKHIELSQHIKDAAMLALRGSNVKCRFSLPDDLWAVEADEGQISQVITNVMLNAQQSMPTGGTIDVSATNIEFTGGGSLSRSIPLNKGDYVRITIIDQGTGIPPGHLERIFDPYFTTKQKGSGLGLATSHSIIKKHDGYIGVESKVGEGSKFYIYLPALKAELPPQDLTEQIIMGSGRILVMDDEDIVRETAGRILKHMGYDVEFAAKGDEAIEKYKQALHAGQPFSAVILDLTIPGGLGGKETLEQLVRIDPGVKAVVSSGYAETSAMAEYRQYGFKGMIAKPYTPAEMSKILHELISNN